MLKDSFVVMGDDTVTSFTAECARSSVKFDVIDTAAEHCTEVWFIIYANYNFIS